MPAIKLFAAMREWKTSCRLPIHHQKMPLQERQVRVLTVDCASPKIITWFTSVEQYQHDEHIELSSCQAYDIHIKTSTSEHKNDHDKAASEYEVHVWHNIPMHFPKVVFSMQVVSVPQEHTYEQVNIWLLAQYSTVIIIDHYH